jgi:CRISPR-associated protein Csx10
MSFTLTLTTESFLLTGSGEGGVLIDSDVVFHPTGFPIIPARRIKGLLKESLEEVMEISGYNEDEIGRIVKALFGEGGKPTYEGKLLFHNLMLPDWEEIVKEVSGNQMYGGFQPDFVKDYFTTEVQQTAIGREGQANEIEGVAKKRSLRNYRVIKPGVAFEGLLETTSLLSEKEEEILNRAVQNLRYAGTRRNRGFGKVNCELKPVQIDFLESQPLTAIDSNKLAVKVTTESPVVLADMLGEQNTVFSRKSISGNQVRGMLANAFIRNKGLSVKNAHLDADFFDLFLSGNVQYGNLSFQGAIPIPLHLHYYKLHKERKPISIFAKAEEDNEITKSLNGRGTIDDGRIKKEGYIPKTTFNFHNSRPNRAAGRSMENDPETGIFYYESLNEGQIFQGVITGDASTLANLAQVLSSHFRATMGRSRSAQYGKVVVSLREFSTSDTSNTISSGKYLMTLESPLILQNEHGHPSPTATELEQVLTGVFGSKVKVEKAATAFIYVEQFNATWQAKSDKVLAFQEGSSFLISLPEIENPPIQFGEWTEQGFGHVAFEPYSSEKTYTIETEEKDKSEKNPKEVNVSSALLILIKEAYEKEKRQLEVKSKATKDAGNAKRINNHLIGRMERLFERSSSADAISDWINETKGKPAGDALQKADLVDYEYKFKINRSSGAEDDWDWNLQKIYWITFFQTLRKKNKLDGNQ